MTRTNTNQSRSRKYRGSSSFDDVGQPSRAPHQDEDEQSTDGGANPDVGSPYSENEQQGISNRPAREEHAFPDSDRAPEPGPDSVEDGPKQQGGPRGRV